jgi:hypothetical protein
VTAIAKAFQAFTAFYNSELANSENKQGRWVISQNNSLKIAWDLFVLMLLIFISIVVPYRIAFTTMDDKAWTVFYYLVDCCFFIDVLLSFCTTYTDETTLNEVSDHKEIVLNYI